MSPGLALLRPRLGMGSLRGSSGALLAALLLLGCNLSDPKEEARALSAQGRFVEAAERLRVLVDEDPSDPEILFRYGAALTQAGEYSPAYFPLRRAMEDPDWVVPAGLTLASGATATGNSDSAALILDEVLVADPDNVEALVARSNARVLTRRHYEGALADADRVLELDPDNLRVLTYRVVSLLGLARIDEAGEALETLERRYSEAGLEVGDTSHYCAARAVFETEKGDTEAADRILRACLVRFPTSATVVNAAIQFYEETRQLERSLEVLRGAYEASAHDRAFRVPLAVRLHAAGQVAEAEELLRDPTESQDPARAAVAWVDLAGYLIEQQQRYDDGLDCFEKAIALVGEATPELLFQYADALLIGERYDDARAVAAKITVPTYRDLVEGRVLLAQNEPGAALERFAAALAEWPNHGIGRYYAARAAEAAGLIDRAIEEYRYSVRADPGGTDARERLARLYVAAGDPNRALTVLYHDVGKNPSSDDAVLIELEILARLRQANTIPDRLSERVEPPTMWGRAVAALATGTRARDGSEAALAIVEDADRLDLKAPESEPALASLLLDLVALGRADEAASRLGVIASDRPDVAAFQALHGDALAASNAGPAARAAYERALALEPENARALAGSAQLVGAEGDTSRALALQARAWAAAPDAPEYGRELATLLAATGNTETAQETLQDLLGRHPTDASAVLQLAQLRLASPSADPAELRRLLRWAARFGAKTEAQALQAEINAQSETRSAR